MLVELNAKSDVGRVRRGNEDNFLVLDLSSEQTWSGADGATPPDKLTRFTLGQKGLVLVVSDGIGGALAGDVASRMAVDTVREMLLNDEDGDGNCPPDSPLVECLKNATKDQSLVQQLVDVGQISEQEAETHMFRNVILQALGAQAELQPVTGRVRVFRDDY